MNPVSRSIRAKHQGVKLLKLKRLLRRIQWKGAFMWRDACPCCGGLKPCPDNAMETGLGHEKRCALALAIGRKTR